MTATTFSNGFIIWNCTGNEKSTNYVPVPGDDKSFTLALDGQVLKFTGKSAIPTVYKDVTFLSNSEVEQYKGTLYEGSGGQILVASKKAIAIVPVDVKDETLIISVIDSISENTKIFGHTIEFNNSVTSITLDKTSILAIGAPDVKLTSNGLTSEATSNNSQLDEGVKYTSGEEGVLADNTHPGTGTLVLNSGSSIVLTNSQLHIGSYQYGEGSLTIAKDKSLTLNGSALNIGAVNNAPVENTVTISTDASVPVTISGSIINVGGACGLRTDTTIGGQGGQGTLTLSANVTDSIIFIGSGGGGMQCLKSG